ncbi:hypothetical protein [Telluribacter sp. SYSU D00476]|uniref:hypothetical protein n=1 Tax=Telluribacter sp. SYSU D00476 TaxID=2811430 RepID=UPI001FF20CB5|nr:hypothetical protein [Telluribacter sp. SYSU D00476]
MIVPKAEAKPPGRKLLKKMSSHTKWLLLSTFSLILISYGLFVFNEAGNLKHTGEPTVKWVLLSIYSLVLINSGIALFGQAIRIRVMIDVRQAIRRNNRKTEKQLDAVKKAAKKSKSPTKAN